MKKSSGSTNKASRFLKKWFRSAKKKPFLFIFPALIIIIIVVIALVCAGLSGKKEGGNTEESTQPVTLEHQAPVLFDDAKWITNNQTGFRYYDDEDYTSIIGIDVSEWTEEIDWEKVHEAGIDFVICRVGYRGYETGKFVFDNNLQEYLEGAEAAGIRTGAYFATQAVNEEEAIEEAEEVLKRLEGHKVTMPVYIDCEENVGVESRTDGLTKEEYTANIMAFCKTIEDAGYRAGIYANETWIDSWMDLEQLTDYDIWFAKYTDIPATDFPFNMWQYSSSGSVDGIYMDVDLDVRVEKK